MAVSLAAYRYGTQETYVCVAVKTPLASNLTDVDARLVECASMHPQMAVSAAGEAGRASTTAQQAQAAASAPTASNGAVGGGVGVRGPPLKKARPPTEIKTGAAVRWIIF